MKLIMSEELQSRRVRLGQLASRPSDGWNGAFRFGRFWVVCSDGEGWDHVSVSHEDRIPTWEDMCRFKDLFFDPEEVVVQYHPAKSEYVNLHPRCLHLWRCQDAPMPTPPSWMVGPKAEVK